MRLILTDAEMSRIRAYLFADAGERMILALCRKTGLAAYRAEEWYYPREEDYARRDEAAVTLRAEAGYPLIRKLRAGTGLSFLQIHSHPRGYPARFSPVDNVNNGFNTCDVREWNPRARFFRVVLSGDGYAAEVFNYRADRFEELKITVKG
ncbi:MAG: hypothetical protein HPY53_14455 [Brevinematales bacterium]|nr:hypothetical protein [Brevinematales bacterium]